MELRHEDGVQATGGGDRLGRGDGSPHGRAVEGFGALGFQAFGKPLGLVLAPGTQADIGFGAVENVGGRCLGMTDQ